MIIRYDVVIHIIASLLLFYHTIIVVSCFIMTYHDQWSMWSTDNIWYIWYIAPSHHFLKGVFFSGFVVHKQMLSFLRSVYIIVFQVPAQCPKYKDVSNTSLHSPQFWCSYQTILFLLYHNYNYNYHELHHQKLFNILHHQSDWTHSTPTIHTDPSTDLHRHPSSMRLAVRRPHRGLNPLVGAGLVKFVALGDVGKTNGLGRQSSSNAHAPWCTEVRIRFFSEHIWPYEVRNNELIGDFEIWVDIC